MGKFYTEEYLYKIKSISMNALGGETWSSNALMLADEVQNMNIPSLFNVPDRYKQGAADTIEKSVRVLKDRCAEYPYGKLENVCLDNLSILIPKENYRKMEANPINNLLSLLTENNKLKSENTTTLFQVRYSHEAVRPAHTVFFSHGFKRPASMVHKCEQVCSENHSGVFKNYPEIFYRNRFQDCVTSKIAGNISFQFGYESHGQQALYSVFSKAA